MFIREKKSGKSREDDTIFRLYAAGNLNEYSRWKTLFADYWGFLHVESDDSSDILVVRGFKYSVMFHLVARWLGGSNHD